MNYPGGKNGAGVYQTIINQMPPHRVYIEAFLGSGAVMRRKRPADVNIGIEIDPVTVAAVKPILAAVDVIQADAVEWLRAFPAAEDVLIYADPPYLMETRSGQRNIYRHELASRKEHVRLLLIALASPAKWIISGYWSELYAAMLADWRTVQYTAQTRGGTREEWLWFNFPEPASLHGYDALGVDRTDRQRIRRKVARWRAKMTEMSPLERNAVFQACQEAQSELSARDPQSNPSARTGKNRCTCPAAVDITFTGHLPGCPA